MNKYTLCRDITSVEGWQQFGCEASSKEEALEKFLKGEDVFLLEEVEIQGLDDFDVGDITQEDYTDPETTHKSDK